MPITFKQRWDEQTTNELLIEEGGGSVVKYFAYSGTNQTHAEIISAMKTHAPTQMHLWHRSSILVEGRLSDSADQFIWATVIEYNYRRPPNDSYTFEIRSSGGTTLQMTMSLRLLDEQANSKNSAYLFKTTTAGTILGLKATDAENGSSLTYTGIPIQKVGIEVVQRLWRSNFEITEYLVGLAAAVSDNVVNLSEYLIFQGGELRFTGFTAVPDSELNTGWKIALTFDYSKNPVLANVNAILAKAGIPPLTTDLYLGHDYLDVLSMPDVIPERHMAVALPVRAAIHQIYPTANFTALFAQRSP
jgi:hypothetical protein